MVVSDTKRFIFIHIPKCAGNTVRSWLAPYDTRGNFFWGLYRPYLPGNVIYDLAHLTIPAIRTVLGEPVFQAYYKFCIVRNPYDRAYSAFLEALKFFPAYRNSDFNKFVENELVHMKFDTHETVHFTPQSRFIYDMNGKSQVNKICRLEHLETDLSRVAETLDLASPENWSPRAVKTMPGNTYYRYMNGYTETSIRIVNEIYANDFERIGFKTVSRPDAGSNPCTDAV